jgi:hypothetical protein
MNKHDSKINLIMSLLTALVSIGLFLTLMGYIFTKEESYSSISSQIEREKLNLRDLDLSKLEQKDYLDKVNSYLDNYLISEDNKNFIEYINNLDLELKADFEIGDIRDDLLDSNKVIFNIFVKGTLEDTLKGVLLVENSPYLIDIQSLELKKGDSIESPWILDLFVKARKQYE